MLQMRDLGHGTRSCQYPAAVTERVPPVPSVLADPLQLEQGDDNMFLLESQREPENAEVRRRYPARLLARAAGLSTLVGALMILWMLAGRLSTPGMDDERSTSPISPEGKAIATSSNDTNCQTLYCGVICGEALEQEDPCFLASDSWHEQYAKSFISAKRVSEVWELIVAQQLSSNASRKKGLFKESTRTTFLENENATGHTNTFMKVGELDWSKHLDEMNRYTFKLKWEPLQEDDLANLGGYIEWTQMSKLTDSNILGYMPVLNPFLSVDLCFGFLGLGKSENSSCIFDGNGGNRCWHNCVGAIHEQPGGGIPGPKSIPMKGLELSIKRIPTLSEEEREAQLDALPLPSLAFR